MKFFALFLPQFHEIPENNEWWGEGFTEWTNVKKAKSLYRGHYQPVHPLNNRYYDLLKKETVQWQTELMHKYNVSGLIYYHYYFNGKLLLEKPAENLLKWKEIDQPFFFCWANHTWYRSWNGTKEVLLEQIYGKEEDWEKHFQYLLPFFLDERYEKKDNRPLLMIFRDFIEKKQYVNFLNRRCIDCGFSGLYLIETYPSNIIQNNNHKNDNYKDIGLITKQYYSEPLVSQNEYIQRDDKRTLLNIMPHIFRRIKRRFTKNTLTFFNGNKLFHLMIKNYQYDQDTIHGTFFSWDNTPRHGNRGYVITPVSKRNFFKYMDLIKDEEYCFINAWNEWAEGMMLEPTEENGYKYLEWIREWSNKNAKENQSD